MDAYHAFDAINLQKSVIKNKNGDPLMPPPSSDTSNNITELKIKTEKREQENSKNSDSMRQLEAELKDTCGALHSLRIKLEK